MRSSYVCICESHELLSKISEKIFIHILGDIPVIIRAPALAAPTPSKVLASADLFARCVCSLKGCSSHCSAPWRGPGTAQDPYL
jgi:hypothetical protein